ncbi:MAG TPA: hypothetical protein VF919_07765 [Gemmatimonadales bacterium]
MVRVPPLVEAFNGPLGAVGAPPGPAELPRAGYVGDVKVLERLRKLAVSTL